MKTNNKILLISTGFILVLPFIGVTSAQTPFKGGNSQSFQPANLSSAVQKTFKMTTLTFGGNGVNFTRVNDQFAVMAGGRGSATFNNRYTLGGGGWGMSKGVTVDSDVEGIYNFVKMGYGGIDFGYLLFPGEKLNFGTKVLVGGGAIFKETVPASEDNDFRMFPVVEPSLYSQIALGKLFKFEIGASYRYIRGTDLAYISDHEMSGFSFYVGFLIKACNCE